MRQSGFGTRDDRAMQSDATATGRPSAWTKPNVAARGTAPPWRVLRALHAKRYDLVKAMLAMGVDPLAEDAEGQSVASFALQAPGIDESLQEELLTLYVRKKLQAAKLDQSGPEVLFSYMFCSPDSPPFPCRLFFVS